MNEIHIHDDDFNFEENILNRPNDLKPWLSYISSVQRRLQQQQSAPIDSDIPGTERMSKRSIYILYERAIQTLPGSYKLWHAYLNLLTTNVSNIPPTHQIYERINEIFERSLYTMHKMPLIWRMYTRFLIRQRKVTKVRVTFDRALQSLPITQHEMWVWKDYIQWIHRPEVPTETGALVYKRFLKLFPSHNMNYVHYLLDRGVYDEACFLFSEQLKTNLGFDKKAEIWEVLCKTISSHPHELRESTKFNVDHTLREGWGEYGDVGSGWVCLAQYHASLGSFEKCRDIFEEGLKSVNTVRDFTTVFNAYAKFEETIVEGLLLKQEKGGEKKKKKKMMDEDDDEEEGESSDDEEDSEDEDEELFGVEERINFAMKRMEFLMDRRPVLLNLVKLRRNPHDVHEWLNRVRLYLPRESVEVSKPGEQDGMDDHAEKIVEIFTEALETIDPKQCTGRIVRVWIEFSRYYEEFHQDLGKARRVLEVGAKQGYPSVNDLTMVHSERAELEIRHQNLDKAREYLRKVLYTSIPDDLREFYKGGKWRSYPPQKLIFRSVGLWTLLVDLLTSFGELEQARSVYEDLIRLKVITVPLIISYADLLESHRFFSAACRVYEKGIHLFQSSEKNRNHVIHIWARYLTLVIKRFVQEQRSRRRMNRSKQDYGTVSSSNSGVEHIRSLFDRCIRQVVDVGAPELEIKPKEDDDNDNQLRDEDEEEDNNKKKKITTKRRRIPSYAKYFYLWYIDFEEKYGRIRHCLELYEKAVEKVRRDERLEMYKMYVRTVSKYHPISKVRIVYDQALQSVGKEDLVGLVIEYVRLEVKLAEIDRARSLFENAARFVCEEDDTATLLNAEEDGVSRLERRERDKDLFFKEWEDFENRFGNLDTFKLMYKIREKYHKKGADDVQQ